MNPYLFKQRKQIKGLDNYTYFLDVYNAINGNKLYSIRLDNSSSFTLNRTSLFTLSENNHFLMVTTCTSCMGEREYQSDIYIAATGNYCCHLDWDLDDIAFGEDNILYIRRYLGAITLVIDPFTGNELGYYHDQGELFYNKARSCQEIKPEEVIEIVD